MLLERLGPWNIFYNSGCENLLRVFPRKDSSHGAHLGRNCMMLCEFKPKTVETEKKKTQNGWRATMFIERSLVHWTHLRTRTRHLASIVCAKKILVVFCHFEALFDRHLKKSVEGAILIYIFNHPSGFEWIFLGWITRILNTFCVKSFCWTNVMVNPLTLDILMKHHNNEYVFKIMNRYPCTIR